MKKNNVDLKVLRFRKSKCSRERNRIFKEILAIYQPRFNTKMHDYPHRFWNDLKSEYNFQVLRAIEKWNENKGTLFTSYLYTYVNLKTFSSVKEKVIFKSNREPSFTACGMYDDFNE